MVLFLTAFFHPCCVVLAHARGAKLCRSTHSSSAVAPVVLQVAHGELTEAPLETLSALAQNVFLPLLTARSNQEGWPDVVVQEVSDSMHRLVATGAVTEFVAAVQPCHIAIVLSIQQVCPCHVCHSNLPTCSECQHW